MAEATLDLDITPALDALDQLNTAFDDITAGFADQLATAISGVGDQLATSLSLPDDLAAQFDALGQAITTALDGSITDALTPQITEIDSQLSGLGADLADSLSNIDVGGLQGAVTDTTDLTDSLKALNPAAGASTDALTRMDVASTGLEASTALLEGSSGGLLKIIAPAAGVFGGIALAVSDLVKKADEAALAQQRMQQVFGSDAPKVFNTNLEGLNLSLGALNTKAGGVNSELQQSVATFGQTAIGAGATRDQAIEVSKRMGELAAIVTTLNPKLGTANDQFTLISRGLGGSARILQRYGITVDQATQSHLALAIAQENGRQKASLFDKQVAGSQLALQSLQKTAHDNGTTLQDELNKGLDSSTIKFREFKASIEDALTKIGAPLVQPALNILQTLEPAFIKLIDAAGKLISAILPALQPLAAAFEAVLGFLTPFIDELAKIPTPVFTVIAGFLALREATKFLSGFGGGLFGNLVTDLKNVATRSQETQTSMAGLYTKSGEVATSTETLGSKLQGLSNNLLGAMAGIAVGIGSMHDFGTSIQGTIGTIGGFTAAGAEVGSMFGPWGTVIGGAVGALGGLTAGLIAGGESLDDYHKKFRDLGQEIEKSGSRGSESLKMFIDKLGETDKVASGLGNVKGFFFDLHTATVQLGSDSISMHTNLQKVGIDVNQIKNELVEVAKTNPAGAKDLLSTLSKLQEQGTDKYFFEVADKGKIAGTSYNLLADAVDKAAVASAKKQIQAEKEAAANQHLVDTIKEEQLANDKKTQQLIAVIQYEQQLTDIQDNLSKQFDKGAATTDTAWQSAQKLADAFSNGVINMADFKKSLELTDQKSVDFNSDLQTLVGKGFVTLAGEIASKGPEQGGQLAHQLAVGLTSGTPELTEAAANSMQNTIIAIQERKDVIALAMKTAWTGSAPAVVDQMRFVRNSIADQMGLVIVDVQENGKNVEKAFTKEAIAGIVAYNQGLVAGNAPGQATVEVNKTAAAADPPGHVDKLKATGKKHGTAYAKDGVAAGITAGASDVNKAVDNLVPTADTKKAQESGAASGKMYAAGFAKAITEEGSAIHQAAVSVIPTGGIGAEDWGHIIGFRYGIFLAKGISDEKTDIFNSTKAVLPTGGLGAEDAGFTIGKRYGAKMGDGIQSEKGDVADSARLIIPTGGLGAESWGFTIGQRFGLAMASGMEAEGQDVYKMGQWLAQMAAAGAANAGSPSEHLFSDLGKSFSTALGEGLVSGAPALIATAQEIVQGMASVNGAIGDNAANALAPMLSPLSGSITGSLLHEVVGAPAAAKSGDNSTHTDKSVVVNVDATKEVDPYRVGIEIGRRLRVTQTLGSNQ